MTALGIGVLLIAAVGCGDKPAPPPAPSPAASATTAYEPVAPPAPTQAADDLPPAPAEEDDDELHDAPHVDRALRLQIEPDADVVAGEGFAIEGVPEDVTVYWPVKSAAKNVYVVYDEGFDHVATIEERPRLDGVAATELDAAALSFEDTASFAVWSCSFAASQTKKGPGRRTSFRGTTHDYTVDVLVDLPWLFEGFTYR